jgi:hypothetical protein
MTELWKLSPQEKLRWVIIKLYINKFSFVNFNYKKNIIRYLKAFQ